MSTLQVDRIEPYQSASVEIVGLNIDTTALNQFTASQEVINSNLELATASLQTSVTELNSFTSSQESLNGSFATTGSNTFVAQQSINGNIIQGIVAGGSVTEFRQNPNYYSDYYGTLLSWRPNTSGGQTLLNLNEKTTVTLLLNAWSGAYDNATGLRSSEIGAEFYDWTLPSYTETTWLAVPQQGNPSFKRTVEVTGSVEVSQVLQLTGLDPLPAGAVGQLAVSSSGDLYYHNGADWQLK